MNSYTQKTTRHQRGMATLFITLILLFLVTLVTLYTASTSVTEMKITSNQHRSEQAIAAAKAGVNWALAIYDSKGVDYPNADGIVDYRTDSPYAGSIYDANGLLTNNFKVFYCNPLADTDANDVMDINETPLSCTVAGLSISQFNNNGAAIVAQGFSDDGTAQHIVTVGAKGVKLIKDVPAPLTTRGFVSDSGNVKIINRYRNATIWAGRNVEIGASASAGTYILNPDVDRGAQIRDNLISSDEGSAITITASLRNRGINADVRQNDTNLNGIDGNVLFEAMISESKVDFEARAESIEQRVVGGTDIDGMKGPIWVEGDHSLTGGLIGCSETDDSCFSNEPAIVVINGNLSSAGNAVIYGLLYVAGDWEHSAGTVVVSGAVIVEGTTTLTSAVGAGNLTVVYDPESLNASPNTTRGMVSGTWKDW